MAQPARRNAVRFELQDGLEMDRLMFSRQVLQKELCVTTNQLDFIFALPGRRIFEVIFTTFKHVETVLHEYEKKKLTTLKKVQVTPLTDIDKKTVHIVLFSERVNLHDIKTWAANFCEVQDIADIMDIDGVKTGTRRLNVKLRRENNVVKHLPNTIQLGPYRGTVYYPGQPKKCRKCGSEDHLAAECPAALCRRCRSSDHPTAECQAPVKCNLCSSDSHLFRDCPNAYANRLKLTTAPRLGAEEAAPTAHWSEELQEEEEEEEEPSSPAPRSTEEISTPSLLQTRMKEAENILDEILERQEEEQTRQGATAPPPAQPSSSRDQLPPQPEPGGLDPTGSSGRPFPSSGDLFRAFPDVDKEQRTTQKRQLKSSSDESTQLEQAQKVWDVAFGSCFDPEALTNFSTVTSMKTPGTVRGPDQKKQKKGQAVKQRANERR